MGDLLVGCSGWNYGDTPDIGGWVGVFYPDRYKATKILIPKLIHESVVVVNAPIIQSAEAKAEQRAAATAAPSTVVGDNIYIAWWTNKTGNDEVMFRVSNDAGATFGDKINLSNTTASDSQDAEISADGSNVSVTWWKRNQTSK